MAEPLKNHFGVDVPKRIASMIRAVWPDFNVNAFVADAVRGYEPLELKQRAAHIAQAMHGHLPRDFEKSADILIASLGPRLDGTESFGMAPFLYFPHVIYVAEHGVE